MNYDKYIGVSNEIQSNEPSQKPRITIHDVPKSEIKKLPTDAELYDVNIDIYVQEIENGFITRTTKSGYCEMEGSEEKKYFSMESVVFSTEKPNPSISSAYKI